MATITKSGFSLATRDPDGSCWVGSNLLAGETLTPGDVVYIKSDGKVWKSNGTSSNAAARAVGMAMENATAGNPVTVMTTVDFNYATGMTPGTVLYVSATAGKLDDAATTGGTAPVAFAIDATRIRFHGSRY